MPIVDTTDWQLTGAQIAKVQLRLPPAYISVIRTDEYRDTNEDWRRTEPFGWISLRVGGVGPTSAFTFGRDGQRAATQIELDSMRDVAESQMGQRPVRCETEADSLEHARQGISVWCGHAPAQLTSCRETISGQNVWIASARDTGYVFGAFTAWATWQYAPHVWVSVSMLARSREEQLIQLRILRTVKLQ
jgi:hypothetical protein